MPGREHMRVAVLLLSDIEGSVALQNRVGTQAYAVMLARHHELFRSAVVESSGGRICDCTGDGFLAEMPSPSAGVNAVLRFQWLLNREPWSPEPIRVRAALHLGEITEIRQEGSDAARPVGMAINYTARLMDLGRGGQVLISRAIWDDARRNVRSHPACCGDEAAPELEWRSHGRYLFKGGDEPVEVFEVGARGIAPLEQPADTPKARRVDDGAQALPAVKPQPVSSWRRLIRPDRSERRKGILCGGVAALVGLLLLLSGALDGASYDFAYLLRKKLIPPEVVVVEMDSASSIQLNQPSDDKWDRRLHAQLIEHLRAAGAKAVAFDIAFGGPARDPSEDEAFRGALQRTGIGVLGAALDVDSLGGVSVLPPFEKFRDVAKWGLVERADAERHLRRPKGGSGEIRAMGQVLAQMAVGRELKAPDSAWLNYYGPPGTIARRSYVSVLSNQVPVSAFSNKVVFVGANTAMGYSGKPGTDYFKSPYTRWSGQEIPGVEINATSYANLVRDDWLRRLPPVMEFAVILLVGLVAGYVLALVEPVAGLIVAATAVVLLGVLLPSQVWLTRVWLPWCVPCFGQIPIALGLGWFLRSQLRRQTRPPAS